MTKISDVEYEDDDEPGAPDIPEGQKSSEAPFEFRQLANKLSNAIFGSTRPGNAAGATKAGGYSRQGAKDRKKAMDEADDY